MAIFGMFDKEPDDSGVTRIEVSPTAPVVPSDNTPVYDLCGRNIGTFGMKLRKGLYIVQGKKYLVS